MDLILMLALNPSRTYKVSSPSFAAKRILHLAFERSDHAYQFAAPILDLPWDCTGKNANMLYFPLSGRMDYFDLSIVSTINTPADRFHAVSKGKFLKFLKPTKVRQINPFNAFRKMDVC